MAEHATVQEQARNAHQAVSSFQSRVRDIVMRREDFATVSSKAQALDALIDIMLRDRLQFRLDSAKNIEEAQTFLHQEETRVQEARARVHSSLRDVREACGKGLSTEVVQERVQKRDLARTELRDICDAQLSEVGRLIQSDAPIHRVDDSADCNVVVDLRKRHQIAKDRVEQLRAQQRESRAAITALVGVGAPTNHGGGQGRMGEGQDELLVAKDIYEVWKRNCDGVQVAEATDTALKRLEETIRPGWLTCAATQGDSSAQSEDAWNAAAIALEREHEFQEQGHRSLPGDQLLRVAERQEEKLKRERQTLAGLLARCENLFQESCLLSQAINPESSTRVAMKDTLATIVKRSRKASVAKDELLVANVNLRVAKNKRKRGSDEDSESGEQDEAEKRRLEVAKKLEEAERMAKAARKAFNDAQREAQDALKLVWEYERDFPEVLVKVQRALTELMEGLGETLSRGVVEVLNPSMSLEAFDALEVVSSPQATRHTVYKVKLGEALYALKEFTLSDRSEMVKCLKEAGLLHDLRHPHIAELKAIFLDNADAKPRMYLQMPFYPNGQLDVWVKDKAPVWWKVRQALADVLVALAYMHKLKVVHSDVKPANILVDATERGRLADLDVSVDSRTRTSTQHATRTTLAFSAGFVAPEVQTGGASPASDVFSVGKTAATEPIRAACCPENDVGGALPEGYSEDAAGVGAFVRQLTHSDPAARPCADTAGYHAFCVAVVRWGGCSAVARQCVINAGSRCTELGVASRDGLECSAGHFVCKECLAALAKTSFEADLATRRRQRGSIPCPMCTEALGETRLLQLLPQDLVQRYIASRIDILEAEKSQEWEQVVQERVQQAIARLHRADEASRKVEDARKHIQGEIFVLQCPRCCQAFVDFDGCCALTCSRCDCRFCAWCFKDCGEGRSGNTRCHGHVSSCRKKPRRVRDPLFAPEAVMQAHYQQHKARKLRRYLRELDAATRESVLREMQDELSEAVPGFATQGDVCEEDEEDVEDEDEEDDEEEEEEEDEEAEEEEVEEEEEEEEEDEEDDDEEEEEEQEEEDEDEDQEEEQQEPEDADDAEEEEEDDEEEEEEEEEEEDEEEEDLRRRRRRPPVDSSDDEDFLRALAVRGARGAGGG